MIDFEWQAIKPYLAQLKDDITQKRQNISTYSSSQLVQNQKQLSYHLLKFNKFLSLLNDTIQLGQTLQSKQKDSTIDNQELVIQLFSSAYDKKLVKQLQKYKIKDCTYKQLNNFIEPINKLWVKIVQQICIKMSISFINLQYFNKIEFLFKKIVSDRAEVNLDRYNIERGSHSLGFTDKCNQSYQINVKNKCYEQESYSSHIRALSQFCLSNKNKLKKDKNKINEQIMNKLMIPSSAIDSPEQQFMPSVATCQSFGCLKKITHFYEKTQIFQRRDELNSNKNKNYFINAIQSNSILKGEDRSLFQEMFCRAANNKSGTIYMGIGKISQLKQSINNDQSMEIDPKFRAYYDKYHKNYEDLIVGYEIQGVSLNRKKAKTKLLGLVKRCCQEYLQPKINKRNVKQKIQFIPVYQNPIKRVKIGEHDKENGDQKRMYKYVIKINLKFKGLQRDRLFYIQIKGQFNSQYHLFTENLSEYSIEARKQQKIERKSENNATQRKIGVYQNKIYGQDVYNQIQGSWYQNEKAKKKQRKIRAKIQKYLNETEYQNRQELEKLLCLKYGLEHSQGAENQHENSQNSEDLQEKQYNFSHQIENQAPGYQNIPHWHSELNKQNYEISVNQKLNCQQQIVLDPHYTINYPNVNSTQNLPDPNLQPNLYGKEPHHKYNNSSVALVSQNSIHLFQNFIEKLKQQKIEYTFVQDPYEKLYRTTNRGVFFISHKKKPQELQKIVHQVDKSNKKLKILNARKQFVLLSPKNINTAISNLLLQFKNLFKSYFQVGFPVLNKNEQTYLFVFRELEHSLFAFILLEYLNIKCLFVNNSKAQNVQLTMY